MQRLLTKLLVPPSLLTLTALAFTLLLTYRLTISSVEQDLAVRLQSITQLAALTLEREIPAGQLTHWSPEQQRNVQRRFEAILRQAEIPRLALWDTRARLILGVASEEAPAEHLPTPPDLRTLPGADEEGAFSTSRLRRVKDRLYSQWCFVPLRDPRGRLAAILGAEGLVDLQARLDLFLRWWISIFAAAIAITLLLGLRISGRVITPLLKLGRAMQQSESGAIPTPVEVESQDEIGELAKRFNEMVEALREKDRLLRQMYHREKERAEYIEGYSDYLLAGIYSGVIGVDHQGTIILCNRAACDLLELDAERVLSRPAVEVLGPEHEIYRLLMGSLFEERLWERREIPVATLGGTSRWLGVSTSPFYDHHRRLMGATAIFTDLTEEKRLQEEMKIKDRLAALGELAAGVAHEIRNPLGAMKGFAELLRRKVERSKMGALAERIISEIDILNRIVTDFLVFARESQPEKRPVELPAFLDSLLDGPLFDQEAGKVRLVKDYPREFPPVEADPVELRKAFLNIVRNALDAMPEGGTLRVSLRREGPWVAVSFQDTGRGIPEEIRDRIFDPFFTTRREGTGLGLAIAHKVVTSHQGKVEVESQVGQGTTFTVKLPGG